MIRVACTALLKRIVAGRANKNGTAMVGGGEDVTSDCIKAIIEFVGVGGIHEVTVNGKPMYEIEIRTVQPVEQTELHICGECDRQFKTGESVQPVEQTRALTEEQRDSIWVAAEALEKADQHVHASELRALLTSSQPTIGDPQ